MYTYPIADRKPQEVAYGKHVLTDDYEWMRNAEDPAVRKFTDEENAYTQQFFAEQGERFAAYLKEQEQMAKELMLRDVVRTSSGLYAMAQYEDGVSRAVLLDDAFGVQEIIAESGFLDGVQIHGILPNPREERLCLLLALRDQAERTSAFVYDRQNKNILAELTGSFFFGWSACGTYAYYCSASHREDGTIANTLCSYQVQTGETKSLYTYQGHAAYGIVFPMDDGGVGVNFAVDYHAGEMVILNPEGEVFVVPYDGNAREYIGTFEGRHYFITDENAPMGKIVTVDHSYCFQEAVTCVAEGKEKISQAGVSNGNILCICEDAGSQSLYLFDRSGKKTRIALPGTYGKIDLAGMEVHSEKPLFTYESFAVPSCVLELDPEKAEASVVYESAKRCEDVVEERVCYTSGDGVLLPAYIVRKRTVEKNGENRTLFYGYGGYNASNYVSAHACGMSVARWLEDGGVYVHCIIRGGGEFGEEWHQGGWKEKKKNVFDDFCTIVEGVIRDRWTNPSRIAICGLSNGGLLMTALITRRPELFGCVIASVPQTDLLGFVYDDRGPMYITEYGDPREDHMFEYMKSYSPYHNLKSGVSYPGIYIQAGAMDNNVPAYHAKKFAAKMQALGGDRPVLLRVLPYGSHDRGTGPYFHQTIAEMRTFIDIELGRGGKGNG